MAEYETHNVDVLIIGAGGAGLRAAIESSAAGCRTAVVCKSLLGKAHTVMAEGGVAAALGNVWPEDNWQVHFRDTMRGGKMLNNWRMAQLHAQEAPDRVFELEEWGALFDRTPDGRILQRDFGGHRYARLAHVGDRTGLELLRTVQHRAVAKGIEVFMECKIIRLLKDSSGAVNGALGVWRESGRFVVFSAKSVVLAAGGVGKIYKFTSNSWESTGDGHALALFAGADLIDMECIQFHPTGMIWPASARGLLVTEGVRGDGGVLKNIDGERFMFRYIADFFKAETADSIEEADQWYDNKRDYRRPPELLPRDEVARAINSEVKAGRGSPHGGVFLDIASRRSPEYIQRRLPSMYHQFKQLRRTSTSPPTAMEIGPHLLTTSAWAASGSRPTPVRPPSPASSPLVRSPAACTVPTASEETPSRTCSSSAAVPGSLPPTTRSPSRASPPSTRRPSRRSARQALAYFDQDASENPYTLHHTLQDTMQDLVGIIRTESELVAARDKLDEYDAKLPTIAVDGHRQFNPGWHLALDLESMLAISRCTTLSAIERTESRGGHTREDFPLTDPSLGTVNMTTSMVDGTVRIRREPIAEMPDDLMQLFEEAH